MTAHPLEFAPADEAYAIRHGLGWLVGAHVTPMSPEQATYARKHIERPRHQGHVTVPSAEPRGHVCAGCGGPVSSPHRWYGDECGCREKARAATYAKAAR